MPVDEQAEAIIRRQKEGRLLDRVIGGNLDHLPEIDLARRLVPGAAPPAHIHSLPSSPWNRFRTAEAESERSAAALYPIHLAFQSEGLSKPMVQLAGALQGEAEPCPSQTLTFQKQVWPEAKSFPP